VVLSEDLTLLRDGLVALLSRQGHSVSAVADGQSLIDEVNGRLAAGEPVDVVVTDIRMPPTFTDEGLRAALALRDEHPELPVLVFSQYIETRYASRLLAGGARGVGYLLKDRVADVEEFLDAVARVASGQTVLDPEVVAQLMGASAGRQAQMSSLSGREREVLELMAEGRSNKAISEQLFISTGTVEKNIASIFAKLGLEVDDSDHRRVLAVLRYLGA
jgi:DNA-binding NarL/FixJ family response regulator